MRNFLLILSCFFGLFSLSAHEDFISEQTGILKLLPLSNKWAIVVTEEIAGPFTIESKDDSVYQEAKRPSSTTWQEIALDKNELHGIFNIEWVHYNYIEFPEALKKGSHYTIKTEKESVTFLYDEVKTISRAIKVNQLGYLPDVAHKYAYLSGFLEEFGPLPVQEPLQYYVIDQKSGKTVLIGKIKLRAKNPHSS
jgi:hypothetical protein